MPGLDGKLATAKVRNDPERYGRPYVVGCTSTALASSTVLTKCGMDKFVRKPLSRASIRSMVQAALNEQSIRSENTDEMGGNYQ